MKQNQIERLAVPTREAARLASVSDRQIYTWRMQGRLPSLKVGTGKRSKVLIPLDGLKRLLAGTTTEAAAPSH
jgi:hypothetical protein